MRWVGVGVIVAVAAWLIVVPWDMSSVDLAGNPIPGRGDAAMGPRIAAVLGIVIAVASVIGVRWPRSRPVALAAGGCATWAALFAWRTAVSRVGGANMWPIGFVMMVLPAALLGPALVGMVVNLWRGRG